MFSPSFVMLYFHIAYDLLCTSFNEMANSVNHFTVSLIVGK